MMKDARWIGSRASRSSYIVMLCRHGRERPSNSGDNAVWMPL
jgi:hypothetical protein